MILGGVDWDRTIIMNLKVEKFKFERNNERNIANGKFHMME